LGMPQKGDIDYSQDLELDLSSIKPSLAGPKRPQDRIDLDKVSATFQKLFTAAVKENGFGKNAEDLRRPYKTYDGVEIKNGDVVIAAITSCTNTSNPGVLLAAGLLAQKAVAKGLKTKPWVKASLAPGSQVVTRYLTETGLQTSLDALGFNLVGYGCTTCIGNSGPLKEPVADTIVKNDLTVSAVLSGNRNFEGRIHPLVKANWLASPPLVVAYALAGRMDLDLTSEPLGCDHNGRPVYLREIWPSPQEIESTVRAAVSTQQFEKEYAAVYEGDAQWKCMPVPAGDLYQWDPKSTYIKMPPYFENMPKTPPPLADISGARVLAVLGDSITTDHISPAGSIAVDSP